VQTGLFFELSNSACRFAYFGKKSHIKAYFILKLTTTECFFPKSENQKIDLLFLLWAMIVLPDLGLERQKDLILAFSVFPLETMHGEYRGLI